MTLILLAVFSALAAIQFVPAAGFAADLAPLYVAYAGSMAPVMERGVRPAVAKSLGVDFRGQAQGATALANLIVAGSIRPDVFVAVTPGPMRKVIAAGNATRGIPIARTEMVIAYAPAGHFAKRLAASAQPGHEPWWQILQAPDLRFGRTDPLTDPQGLNIIFAMELAARYYKQADLADKILGPTINPRQIFQEPEVMARLQAGQLDASSAYKTQPAALKLPYLTLPKEINLGDAAMASYYRTVSLSLKGKTLHPAPLVFYAAVLKNAANPKQADRFVNWLSGAPGRDLFSHYYYDGPGDAATLTQ